MQEKPVVTTTEKRVATEVTTHAVAQRLSFVCMVVCMPAVGMSDNEDGEEPGILTPSSSLLGRRRPGRLTSLCVNVDYFKSNESGGDFDLETLYEIGESLGQGTTGMG